MSNVSNTNKKLDSNLRKWFNLVESHTKYKRPYVKGGLPDRAKKYYGYYKGDV